MGQHVCSITAGCSWCDTSRAIAKQRTEIKPFRKTEHKIVTLTIDEQGDAIFLASPENDVFLELGSVITKRASHVLPTRWIYRQAFRLLRMMFGDKGRVAQWTREWNTTWLVDTRPVGGPKLPEHFISRQDAIDREVQFLNQWFLERGIR